MVDSPSRNSRASNSLNLNIPVYRLPSVIGTDHIALAHSRSSSAPSSQSVHASPHRPLYSNSITSTSAHSPTFAPSAELPTNYMEESENFGAMRIPNGSNGTGLSLHRSSITTAENNDHYFTSRQHQTDVDHDMLSKKFDAVHHDKERSSYFAANGNNHSHESHQQNHKHQSSSSSIYETVRFLVLCILWYSTSAMTNNLGKQILNIFRYPVTLTLVQFAFVASFSVLVEKLGWGRLRPWSREIVMTTAPLSGFQIVGHIFSSIAISRVTVSFAHTVKALSPLFTVAIYRVFYSIAYSYRVYVALIPLTAGVMLVCSNKVSFNLVGFVCALGSTFTFVLQNIFSKKLFTSPAPDTLHSNANGVANGSAGTTTKPTMKKLDKLNLLFYSSALAFAMMFPIWFYSEGTTLFFSSRTANVGEIILPSAPPPSALHVAFLFFLNGTSHFLQNMFAFWILSLVSPVTYSIASLVKRIYVIVASIIYFGDAVAPLQSFGIVLSVVGLYMYDLAKRDVDKGEAKLAAQPVLPGGS